ncbi:disease resistance protein RGA3 [Canna indica]|uniref:Disease resistance protein RGA3 n=1 Tax=Canna indica TaxID=4628 RepID=A0AAQ3KG31_9LILI|nr:disease resistance protein RGA3 [Canna indica]
MAEMDLKRILLQLLPSATMLKQGQLLHIGNHLKMIQCRLWAINAVFMDAQLRALKESDLELLVNDITTIIVDIDDLLGRILQWKPKAATAASNHSLLPFSSSPNVPDAFRQALLLELKEMAKKLNYLVNRALSFDLRKEMMESMDPRQEEFATLLENEVVRRDKDKDNITKMFQGQQNLKEDVPVIHAVRGKVGTGKTTLARMVFHDPWVRQHFQHFIWVDSPNSFSFDPVNIAREFTEWITKEPCADRHLQQMWLRINGKLDGKRYLLVIDDIDIKKEDNDKWEQFKQVFLRVGLSGSRVIVLATNDVEIGSIKEYHDLDGLAEVEWSNLFSKLSLIPDDDDTGKFQSAMTWFKKDPRPIRAKLLGLLLRYGEPIDQVFEDLLLHCLHPRDELLRLYHLLFQPRVLEDWTHDFEDLLQMLTAEGIVQHARDRAAITKDLRKLVSLHKVGTDEKLQSYITMKAGEALIPQQCRHLALLVDQSTTKISLIKDKTLSRLRTLILILDGKRETNQKCRIAEISKEMFSSLGDLRVLDLHATMITQLDPTVGEMKNLRYLNLSQSEIEELPESLGNLQNLQTLKLVHCERLHRLPEEMHNLQNLQVLKLSYCKNLKRLPNAITALVNLLELDLEECHGLVELPHLGNMKKLKYLNMLRCVSLTRMPSGIRQLVNIQRLSVRDAPGSCSIPELQELVNLEELNLENLQLVSIPRDVGSKKLKDKRYLRHLLLRWNMDSEADSGKALEQLDGFQPSTALRKLEVISYQGKEFPTWMKEGQPYHYTLVEIKLVNLKKCKSLPPLGQLPRLKIVEISGMDEIISVGDEFYGPKGTFASLEKLTFSNMPILKTWGSVERKKELFPCLAELTLIQCPQFSELKVRLEKVKRLNAWMNNEKMLTSEFGWDNLKGIEHLEIVGCEKFNQCKELPEWIHSKVCNPLIPRSTTQEHIFSSRFSTTKR